MSEWKLKKLSELGKFSRGKSKHRPRNDENLFINGTYPLVQTGEIKNSNLYVIRNNDYYNEFGLSQSKLWPEGTLCITIAANIAETAILAYPMCFPDSIVGFNSYPNESSELFVYYIFEFIKKEIQKTSSGSIQDNINIDYLTNLQLMVPGKAYQDKIVELLSSLDQKIALNNQINEELEAMAKTLYDYWFVQFDFPDENGKPYKSSGGKMVYNDQLKREIPEGWGVEKVSEIAKTGSGGTPKSTTDEYYSNGTIPWINSGELNKSIIISTTNYITEFGLENSSAKLFPADSILIAMYGATAGKVSFLAFESSTNQAICAVTLDDNRLKYYFKFFIEDLYLHLVTLSSGSARDNLSQELIRNLLMTIPDERVVENFFNLVDSYFLQITNNLKQNQELTQLRDWLLPMLMNGQVKV